MQFEPDSPDHNSRWVNLQKHHPGKELTPCPSKFIHVHSKAHHMSPSASFLAEISVRSPRKLYIFMIYKNIFWIKVSKKHFIWFWKQQYWWAPYPAKLHSNPFRAGWAHLKTTWQTVLLLSLFTSFLVRVFGLYISFVSFFHSFRGPFPFFFLYLL